MPGSNFNSPIVADLTRSALLGALLSLYSTMYGIGTCSWIIVMCTLLCELSMSRKRTQVNTCTVEPLNKGHFGSSLFVLYTEVVLCSEAK